MSEHLDAELLAQELANEAATAGTLASLLAFVGGRLLALGSAAHDRETQAWLQGAQARCVPREVHALLL